MLELSEERAMELMHKSALQTLGSLADVFKADEVVMTKDEIIETIERYKKSIRMVYREYKRNRL